jgi:D-sedoheptulose 7-phosphate isomerase
MDKLHISSTLGSSVPAIRSSEEYFGMYRHLINKLPFEEMGRVVDELMFAFERSQQVFVFGNGGSAALASHFACDLGKGTIVSNNGQKRFRVMSLTDNIPLVTAWANDHSYEQVFAQQLQNFVMARDVAFAISGSGNSPNILRGLEVAKHHGARTVGLTGFNGGKMQPLCDICVIVPSNNMQLIEDFHLSVTHAVFSVVRHNIAERFQAQRLAASGSAD